MNINFCDQVVIYYSIRAYSPDFEPCLYSMSHLKN